MVPPCTLSPHLPHDVRLHLIQFLLAGGGVVLGRPVPACAVRGLDFQPMEVQELARECPQHAREGFRLQHHESLVRWLHGGGGSEEGLGHGVMLAASHPLGTCSARSIGLEWLRVLSIHAYSPLLASSSGGTNALPIKRASASFRSSRWPAM